MLEALVTPKILALHSIPSFFQKRNMSKSGEG